MHMHVYKIILERGTWINKKKHADTMENNIMNATVLTCTALYTAFRVGDLCHVLLVPNVAIKDGQIQ